MTCPRWLRNCDPSPWVARYYLFKCRLRAVISREVLPISSPVLHRRPRRLRVGERTHRFSRFLRESVYALCRCQTVIRRRRTTISSSLSRNWVMARFACGSINCYNSPTLPRIHSLVLLTLALHTSLLPYPFVSLIPYDRVDPYDLLAAIITNLCL